MSQILLFNKPYGVLSQFSRSDAATPVLADYIDLPGIYPAGRLDKDSEGLLLLTDDGKLQHCISHPRHKLVKTYWAQVEGIPDETAVQTLIAGVQLKDGVTAPADVKLIPEPAIWPRTPPIRYRAAIPTSWLELKISEGRNRQVRRMTAAVGFPTLRLIRYAVGIWTLEGLAPGQWRLIEIDRNEVCHDTHTRQSPSAVTVAAMIEEDGRFLMVEEIDNAEPVYNQPAGHVEPGESLLAAVIRETLEETTWHFQPESLIGIYRWQLPGSNEIYLRHCFSGNVLHQDPERQLDRGILRTVWLSLAELQQRVQRLRSPLVLACLEDYVAGQRYPLSLYRDLGQA